MNFIAPLDPKTTQGKAQPLFDGVKAKIGMVPNLFRVMGHAPAALGGYLALSEQLGAGDFAPALREQIALAVAESNQCEYCLSAHSFVGGKLGLSPEAIAAARDARAADPRTNAILKLARAIVVQRGEIGAEGLERARAAGLSNADVLETVANVAINIFSNYVNHIAGTDIDFPRVSLAQASDAQPGQCSCS